MKNREKKWIRFTKELIESIGITSIISYLIIIGILYLLGGIQPLIISNLFNKSTTLTLINFILLFLSFISDGVINFPQNYMLQNVRKNSKIIVWNDITKRNFRDVSNINLGEIQNLSAEVSFTARSLQYEGLSFLFETTLVFTMYSIILFNFDSTIGTVYTFSYLIYYYLSIQLSKSNSGLIHKVLDKTSELNAFFIDYFRNFETIYSNSNIKIENNHYECLAEEEQKSYYKLQNRIDTNQLFLQFILGMITVSLMLIALLKEESFNATVYLIFIYSAINVNGFGKRFLAVLESFDRLKISLGKLNFAEHKRDLEIRYLNNSSEQKLVIQLEGVNFRYDEKDLFNNFNLNIHEHDKILITGGNGSGKSTLAKIIKGLITPDNGNVFFYTNPKNIGYYSQNMTLFDRSIYQNICYPQQNVNIDFVKELVDVLNLKSVTSDYEDLLLKKPGDFGEKLSGGEKQKIILARSIVNDKDIIIFDEIDSALDQMTQGQLRNILKKYFDKKTIIMISHREVIDKDYFNKLVKL